MGVGKSGVEETGVVRWAVAVLGGRIGVAMT